MIHQQQHHNNHTKTELKWNNHKIYFYIISHYKIYIFICFQPLSIMKVF